MKSPFRRRKYTPERNFTVQIRTPLDGMMHYFDLDVSGWIDNRGRLTKAYANVRNKEAVNLSSWLQRILHPRKRDKNGRFCK